MSLKLLLAAFTLLLLSSYLHIHQVLAEQSNIYYNYTTNASSIVERFQEFLGTWIDVAVEMLQWTLASLLNMLSKIGRLIYVTLGVGGFTLWSTGLSRYTGKRLLIGALMLAIFLEVFVKNLPELS
ncbi:MAG: hypothetical protein DRJ33_05575 [Candidatus Methanomethylicota archaeon]|uniref:Uncharacterized protein n=1 Tax=Thermoproteota archaeon TaxID=2056631 RepID=A0A497EWM2_9CREN|nr:MAG: hypothetical protein DRJ33_05575 [Candidatus Verstraetearchaeota archaeon]